MSTSPSGGLPDGVYDAFIIDVRDAGGDTQELEVTIVAGEFKGLVAHVVSSTALGDEIDLIGLPATVAITDGRPTLTIDS